MFLKTFIELANELVRCWPRWRQEACGTLRSRLTSFRADFFFARITLPNLTCCMFYGTALVGLSLCRVVPTQMVHGLCAASSSRLRSPGSVLLIGRDARRKHRGFGRGTEGNTMARGKLSLRQCVAFFAVGWNWPALE